MTAIQQPASTGPAGLSLKGGEGADEADLEKEVTLLELLDRVLDKGVVLTGDITLSVADVDLVYVGLRVLLSSVEAAQRSQAGTGDAAAELSTGRADAPAVSGGQAP